jgi:hypothetical protein
VVVLGAPVVLVGLLAWLVVRTVRRRREDALLISRDLCEDAERRRPDGSSLNSG